MRGLKPWWLGFCGVGLLALLVQQWLQAGSIDGSSEQATGMATSQDKNTVIATATTPTLNDASELTTKPLSQSGSVTVPALPACLADSVAQQQLKQILQQRKQQSEQLIRQLLQSGTQAAAVATLLHQLGGDMVLMAQHRADYPENPNTIVRFEQGSRTISTSLMLLILQAIQSQDYQEMLAALQADPAPQQLAWHGQPLLTALLAADPAISPLTLQQLIDSGLQPVFADIVAATALQLSVPLVDTLNMAFEGDKQQLWFHQYRRNNLTLLAASVGNVALYDYWLAQGVPALISAADLNAFDLLPFPANSTELQERLPMIRSFSKQGLLPRQFTQLTSWLLLLPTEDAARLSEQLAAQPGHQPSSTPQALPDPSLETPPHNLNVHSAGQWSEAILATNQWFKTHIASRHQCGQLYQLGNLLLSLDDSDQQYGAALKASFRLRPQQITALRQLLSLQQQLELLLDSAQWQVFIREAQEQLMMLPPAERSSYILQQLLQYQAPADIVVMQLHRHYRRFGVPSLEVLDMLKHNDQPQLQSLLLRLAWWQQHVRTKHAPPKQNKTPEWVISQ